MLTYSLVTPVRDEEAFIGPMIESILLQNPLPTQWVIVDDGSRDRTPEIVLAYARSNRFIDYVQLGPRESRQPGGEGAIPAALARLRLDTVTFLARFDADLLFPPRYISNLFSEFDRDPRLGIAGGGLYVEKSGRLVLEKQPEYHVRGALKMYRRECFTDIGGLVTHIGWDTIDEVAAWTKGWKTRSFEQYRVIHRRPTGLGVNKHRAFFERGKADYFSWSSPTFAVAKAAKIAVRDCDPTAAGSYFAGFSACYLSREKRLDDRSFVKVRRKQQRQRLLAKLHIRSGRQPTETARDLQF